MISVIYALFSQKIKLLMHGILQDILFPRFETLESHKPVYWLFPVRQETMEHPYNVKIHDKAWHHPHFLPAFPMLSQKQHDYFTANVRNCQVLF